MCGIIGIIGKTNKKEIKKMLKPIKHRGFHRNEFLVFNDGGMGTNRLPIVDSKNGRQPKTNESKTIFAVMNGEVFNYRELKKDLIKKGYFFQTDSDTELIPALYEEYGINFIDYIDSEMYAIIIYDKKKDSWIIARDRLGVKPLYYSETDEKIYFASEAKQLTDLGVKIKIFPPGHVYKDGKFYSINFLNDSSAIFPNRTTIEKIRGVFDRAVEKRIPDDQIVGVLLSGGVDSSAVLTTALKFTKNIIAFIVGNKESKDRKVAEKLCKELGVKYKIINPKNPTTKDIAKLIKILETDEKNTIRHSWVSLLAMKKIKKYKIKVVLCGEGADELFGGYEIFKEIPDGLDNKARKLLIKNLYLSQLPRVDRTSMNYTIEMRVPFLDNRLVNLALRLKTSKVNGNDTKEVLRYAFEDRLPKWVAWRKKIPFSAGAGVVVDDNDSVFKKVIKKTGLSEQKFIDKYYNLYKYNLIIKDTALNKDNLLSFLKNRK